MIAKSARKAWHVLFGYEPAAVDPLPLPPPPQHPPPAPAPALEEEEDAPQETGQPLGRISRSPNVKPSQSPSTPAMVKKIFWWPQSPSDSRVAAHLPQTQLIEAENHCPATQEMIDGGKPSQQPSPGHLDSPKPRPSPSSTNELHGLREEEEVTTSLLAPVVSVPPGNAVTGEKEASVEKRPSYVRVWSETDEVRILEGLAAHVVDSGFPPARSELRAAVAGHLDKTKFTVSEIYEKVRRLKSRYQKQHAAAAGAPPPGYNGEELQKYELSKMIWGDVQPRPKRANKEETGSDEACVRRGFKDLRRTYPHFTVAVERISATKHRFLRRAFELIDDSKVSELDAKVKRQRILDVKMEMNRDSARREVLSALIRYVD